MDWQKDLESYPAHFQAIVKAQFGDGNQPDEPAPVELVPSGIRPIPAEKQIKHYLDAITPLGRPTRFRFESFLFGVCLGVLGLAIVIILGVLGGVGS